MTARGYPRQSPIARLVRSGGDAFEEREARAQAAAGEIWRTRGLALIDPEDFPDLIRLAIIQQAERQYGKRGRR